MSVATDLIAEIKAKLAEVEKAIVEFEHDAETEIGHWTDLAQLRIAASRLDILHRTLHNRLADRPVVEPAAEEESEQPAPRRSRRRIEPAAEEE